VPSNNLGNYRARMDATNTVILMTSALLFASLLGSMASVRLGFPLLLVFLAVGMLAGEDGLIGVQFDDFQIAFLIGNVALATILLDGGLRTNIRSFRVALRPAVSLATAGVVLTAVAVGAAAAWLLELDWRFALLLGAIVGSTDAAAVFGLLRQSDARLNERVEATLEIESGSNDPMAIFLVVLMVAWLEADVGPGAAALMTAFLQQLGLGVLGGVAGGWLLAITLQRIRLVEGLYALLVASGGLALFAAINQLGGSGFLAIYLAGLMIANRPTHATEHVMRVMDGLAWLAQAGMFLVLGLLVAPSAVLRDIPLALALAVFLILVARPVAVTVSLLPFRFPAREVGFISWVGLRGAVPIVLAMFPVMAGLENSNLLFNVTFAVVLVSLIVQGTTIPLAARLFRVQVPRLGEPLDRQELALPIPALMELVQLRVEPGARCIGQSASEMVRQALPQNASCAAIVRGDRVLFPDESTRFETGDVAVMILPLHEYERLVPLFARLPMHGPLSIRRFFGEFVLDGDALADDVAAVYGAELGSSERGLTIAELVASRLNRALVVGDRTSVGPITITVRELEAGRVSKLGLKLTQAEEPG
jgi:potassium/hydrogen antiporter